MNVFPFDQLPPNASQKHDILKIKTNLPFQINQFVKVISLARQGFLPRGKK
jgi:hypothetical protein